MPVVPTEEILDRAFAERYGVAAINIVNDLTLEAVLAAAAEERAPLIVQTSVKTVRSIGRDVLYGDVGRRWPPDVPVPVALHLDHCPDRAVITDCLERGLELGALRRLASCRSRRTCAQTVEVVAEAARVRRPRRGRDRGHHRASRTASAPTTEAERQSLDVVVDFIEHDRGRLLRAGHRQRARRLQAGARARRQRVTDIVDGAGIPMALHGGTGLTDEQFRDLIARGCAKVNISTALKDRYMKSNLELPRGGRAQGQVGPAVAVQRSARARSTDMAARPHARSSAARARRRDRADTLIFDCDGVLADTERYGHLPAFNQTFARVRPAGAAGRRTSTRRSCSIGGGKERMAQPARRPEFVAAAGLPADDAGPGRGRSRPGTGARPRSTPRWSPPGAMPARPGIAPDHRRGAATPAGRLAVASTSAEPSVRAVLEHAVGAELAGRRSPVFAGDSCRARSRHPDIYLLAVERARRSTRPDALVVEDSRNGLLAALGAGLRCVVTVNGYTEDEDFTEAALVVSSASATRTASRPRCWPTAAAATPGDLRRPRPTCEACMRPRPNGAPRWPVEPRPTSSSSCARSRRPPSTTRSTSATSTRSSATATSATRWPAASRSCSPTGTASTAPTSARS